MNWKELVGELERTSHHSFAIRSVPVPARADARAHAPARKLGRTWEEGLRSLDEAGKMLGELLLGGAGTSWQEA